MIWLLLLFVLMASAFFSGMEIAFVSSNKLMIELDKKRGYFSGKILSHFMNHAANFISTMLIGNNIVLVMYGIVMAMLLEPLLILVLPEQLSNDSVILFAQTIVSTIVVLFLGEYIPKSLFRINPNYSLNIFYLPALFFYIVLFPLVMIINGITFFFWRYVFRIKMNNDKIVFSSIDLYNYIDEFSDDDNVHNEVDQEVQMFQRAIDLQDVKLRECMVPRTEIEAVNEKATIEELKEKFIETGLSKILVYKESIDNIVGYIHSFDIFKNPQSITEVQRSISIVPETMPANKLLNKFIKDKKNIAVVVDEFGGTSGIITLEDLVEEIFGEIRDEYDVDELMDIKNSENEYIFSARLSIDDINEKYGLGLPQSDVYETLSGLIFNHYEDIPKLNDTIVIKNFEFTILQSSKTKIIKVKLRVL